MQAEFTAAERIKLIRRQCRLSQQQFADKLGVSRSYLGDIESGRSQPSRHFLTSLKTTFDVKTDWILGGVSEAAAPYMADEAQAIQDWIAHFLRQSDDKNRAWFVRQFERTFPEFLEWYQNRPK